jgi:hypothetical protein
MRWFGVKHLPRMSEVPDLIINTAKKKKGLEVWLKW